MEDWMIVRLLFQRSEEAVAELDRKYGKICAATAYNILKNKEDAEECVNDAFLAVWNTVPPRKPESLLAYVCRIVRNLSLKKYHYNMAEKRNQQYHVLLEEIGECLESGRNVEEEMLARELAGELNAFLGTLKKKERAVFILRYWYCFSVAEIADKTGMKVSAVRVSLHRTRKKMSRYLEQREDRV